MMKKLTLVLALMLLPGAAMAQHANHGNTDAAKTDKAKAEAQHQNFVHELIAKKAELQLTDEQVAKLEQLAVKMDELHKSKESHGKASEHAGHGNSKEHPANPEMAKLHEELMAVFTPEQQEKVRSMMKAHMEKGEHMKQKSEEKPPVQ